MKLDRFAAKPSVYQALAVAANF